MTRVHPTAIVAANAELAGDVVIGPYTVVGAETTIGAGTSIGAHVVIADRTSIEFVYRLCAFLPAIGLITMFLPHIEGTRVKGQGEAGSRGETELA